MTSGIRINYFEYFSQENIKNEAFFIPLGTEHVKSKIDMTDLYIVFKESV